MHLRRAALASAVASASLFDAATAYLEFTWNTEKYFGPDGPWQGITMGVQPLKGGQQYQITLLPAIKNSNTIAYFPTQKSCEAFPDTNCGAGGMIPLPANYSYVYWFSSTDVQDNWRYNYTGPSDTIDTLFLPGGITQTATTASACTTTNTTYPNGKVLPAEVGFYSLGGTGLGNTVSTPNSLYTSSYHITQSNSFGLHYGAAKLGYQGSLIFGGYDPARAIGPVINYQTTSDVDTVNLLDIIIGVETGGSPFSFDSMDNLLIPDASSTYAQTSPAQVYPNTPYIYLPQAALDKITGLLPVKLDKSGYYLWDTGNALYQKIVSSPAYLGFKFQTTPNGVANTIIKIPFALLNMTLSPLITGYDSDVPYLPLVVVTDNTDVQDSVWLGRAFLQGAYYAVNWNANISWLAQGSGPGNGNGLGLNPLNLDNGQLELDVQSDDTLFAKSWENHWTPLANKPSRPVNPSTTNTPSPSPTHKSSGGLSGGAIAGIVVGVVGGLIIVAIIAWLFIRQRRRARNAAAGTGSSQHEKRSEVPANTDAAVAAPLAAAATGPHVKENPEAQQQYNTSPAPHYNEYHQSYTHPPYYLPNELHGESQMPNELPDNSREPRELPTGDLNR